MSLDEWNERHREREPRDDPSPLLVDATRNVSPGRALDLACGTGRNALWLARNGWHVVAIDGSTEAIRILRERAKGIPIDARVADLEHEPLVIDDESFDAIVIIHFLHRPLFDEVRRTLKPGGLFVAETRTRGINPAYCVAPGELARTFADWEIVHSRENDFAEFIARKPSPSHVRSRDASA